MNYVAMFLLTALVIVYSAYELIERYRLRKKNEELRDRYTLLKESIEKEGSTLRARYRISHESEKIEAIRSVLRKKYGDHIISELKLLQEIVNFEQSRASEAGVALTANVTKEAEDLLLLFSEDECISFFLNLLDNAIEAAADSEGGRTVQGRTASGAEEETTEAATDSEGGRTVQGKTASGTEEETTEAATDSAVRPEENPENARPVISVPATSKVVEFTLGHKLQLRNSKRRDAHPTAHTGKADAEKHGFGLGVIEDRCAKKGLSIEYKDTGDELITTIKKTN